MISFMPGETISEGLQGQVDLVKSTDEAGELSIELDPGLRAEAKQLLRDFNPKTFDDDTLAEMGDDMLVFNVYQWIAPSEGE